MNKDVIILPERAEVDMFCDKCKGEISEGQDYFYSEETEDFYCEYCIEE